MYLLLLLLHVQHSPERTVNGKDADINNELQAW